MAGTTPADDVPTLGEDIPVEPGITLGETDELAPTE